MSNPEFGPVDPSTTNNRLHPDIPVEEPPYDEDTTGLLQPGIPVEELPYPEDPVEQPLHHLTGEQEIPKTLEGHIALLSSAIEEAIEKKRPDKPLIKIGEVNMTIPRYLALIAGGSRSGLTREQRVGLNNLYIGPWSDSNEHAIQHEPHAETDTSQTAIAEVAVASALSEQHDKVSDDDATASNQPHVITDLSDEDDPYERGQARRAGTWEDRIAP